MPKTPNGQQEEESNLQTGRKDEQAWQFISIAKIVLGRSKTRKSGLLTFFTPVELVLSDELYNHL